MENKREITTIKIKKDTRLKLNIVKAQNGLSSVDDVINMLLDKCEKESKNEDNVNRL